MLNSIGPQASNRVKHLRPELNPVKFALQVFIQGKAR